MIIIGILATIAYITTIVALRWNDFHSLEVFRNLKLNELGDFLAGVLGPLSFFWLIIGYVQQQKELSLNTEALRLQAAELKSSVEQQKNLVLATREQIAIDKNAARRAEHALTKAGWPIFSIPSSRIEMKQSGITYYKFEIANSGAAARNVKLATEPPLKQLDKQFALFEKNEKKIVGWSTNSSGPAPEKFKIIFECLDSNDTEYTKIINLKMDEEANYISDAL